MCLALFFFLFNLSSFSQIEEKPVITKLPFAFPVDGKNLIESTPVQLGSRLFLVANTRPHSTNPQFSDEYIYIISLQDGTEIARFGQGHYYVSGFVNGDELNVFAGDYTNKEAGKTPSIDRLYSKDLINWKTEKVIYSEKEEALFNSSVCKDDNGYIMAYESNNPIHYCIKFAKSTNLSDWKKIDRVAFTGENNEYSACPVIRYFKPYYYIIYLHAPTPGHNGWVSYMARSKDLKEWELTPYNPILEAEAGEGINNSDVDIIQYNEKSYFFYLTGDQQSWNSTRIGMYDGELKEFFENHFSKEFPGKVVSAKL